MAFLEERKGWFRVVFTVKGQRFAEAIGTQDRRVADAVRGSVDRTLLLIRQRLLPVPEGADLKEFILSGGQQVAATSPPNPTPAEPTLDLPLSPSPLTLEQFRERYIDTLRIGSVEPSTLALAEIHFRHLTRTLGAEFAVGSLVHGNLQAHINARAKNRGLHRRPLSAVTIRKEIAGFRAAWNWGIHAGLVVGTFPNKGLKYPKTAEKAPFQTRAEIERQIELGGLDVAAQAELWECLFLTKSEIDELLNFVKANARQPWIYAMVCFAAHTGARRSEMVRARIGDIDLDAAVARIHEKKRAAGKLTSRRVPLSPFVVGVLRDWLSIHPGGPQLFAQSEHVFRSRKHRVIALPVTRDEAHDHLKRTLGGSKWSVLRGWHVLRHSFISLCASKGIDQRVVRAWVGHTTAEMEARYTHLYPSAEKQLLGTVFG